MDFDPRKVIVIHISKFDILLNLMGKKILLGKEPLLRESCGKYCKYEKYQFFGNIHFGYWRIVRVFLKIDS